MRKIWLIAGVAAAALVIGYAAYQAGQGVGREKFSGQADKSNPRKWLSRRPGFSIEFPSDWGEIRNAGSGAEFSCSSRSGATAKVFVHQLAKGETADSVENVVVGRYKAIYGRVRVLERKDFERNGARYRVFVLKGTDTEHPDEVHSEAMAIYKKICLLIAFTCPTEKYELLKKDFEKISDSVVFSK